MTESRGIGGRMAKGAAWMVLGRLAVRFIGLISTMILARILVPADFGLVAIATLVVGVLDIMGEFSFELALIKDQKAKKADYDTVWTLSIIRGLVIAGILLLGAGEFAAFMNDARLEEIFYWLALGAAIDGFRNSGVVDFRKELHFDKEFRFLLYGKLIQFVVTIACAYLLQSYWALVIGIIAHKSAYTLLSYLMHPLRPVLSLARTGAIFRFSKWLLLNNILIFLNTRGDTLILGKFTNAATVGVYTVAQEIANLTTTELVWPIMRAVYPGYAKLSEDRNELARSYLDVLGLVVVCALPIAIGLGLLAESVVLLMLGDQWLEAIPIIQILVIFGACRLCWANAGSVFLAIDRPRLVAAQTAIGLAVGIPAMIAGVHYAGAIGVSVALVGSSFVTLLATLYWVVSSIPVTVGDITRTLWRPLLSTTLMAAAVLAVLQAWPTPESILLIVLHAIAMSLVGAIVFVAVLLLLWLSARRPHGPERLILTAVSTRKQIGVVNRLLGPGEAS